MNYKKIIFLILELLNNWPNIPGIGVDGNEFSFIFRLNHIRSDDSAFIRSFKLVSPIIT